MYIKVKVF